MTTRALNLFRALLFFFLGLALPGSTWGDTTTSSFAGNWGGTLDETSSQSGPGGLLGCDNGSGTGHGNWTGAVSGTGAPVGALGRSRPPGHSTWVITSSFPVRCLLFFDLG